MVRTPVQTNHMCDCPNRLHIDVVGTAALQPTKELVEFVPVPEIALYYNAMRK
jgi:hypothetical protein